MHKQKRVIMLHFFSHTPSSFWSSSLFRELMSIFHVFSFFPDFTLGMSYQFWMIEINLLDKIASIRSIERMIKIRTMSANMERKGTQRETAKCLVYSRVHIKQSNCTSIWCVVFVRLCKKSERKTAAATTTEQRRRTQRNKTTVHNSNGNSNNSPKIDSKHSWNPWLHVNHIECARVCACMYELEFYLHSEWLLTLVGFVSSLSCGCCCC